MRTRFEEITLKPPFVVTTSGTLPHPPPPTLVYLVCWKPPPTAKQRANRSSVRRKSFDTRTGGNGR